MNFSPHFLGIALVCVALTTPLLLSGCNLNGSISQIQQGFLGGIYLSPEKSTLSVSNATVLSGSSVTVTLTTRDQNGKPFWTQDAPSIQFSLTGGTSRGTFSSVTDHGDGTYTATFTSTGVGSPTTISPTIDGTPLASPLPRIEVTLDSTAPAAVTGFLDGNTTSDTTQAPSMSWNATTDSGSGASGIDHYELAIGTSAGGSDVVNWTNVGNTTTYQFTGLSLTNGNMYYGSIRAVDTAGNVSSVTQGDGFAVVTDTAALNLSFTGGTLPVQVQFTNTSGSGVAAPTYYDSSGILTSAPENLFLYSQDFSQSVWIGLGTLAFGSGSTQNVSTPKAPDGTSTAAFVSEDTSTGEHYVKRNAGTYPAGTYCFSLYVSDASTRNIMLQLGGTGFSGEYIVVDLSTGTISSTGGTIAADGITNVGNGWYRPYICGTADGVGYSTPQFIIINGTTGNYTGDGSSGVYVWGAQFEAGSSPTSYIYTAGAKAYGPRLDYDPANVGSPRGLLIEEQETNYLINSSNFENWSQTNLSVTTGATTAPDGTTTGEKLVEDNTTNYHVAVESYGSGSSGTAYTFSIFAKSGERSRFYMQFDNGTGVAFSSLVNAICDVGTGTITANSGSPAVSIQPVGNGWYRCSMTATTTSAGSVVAKLYLSNGSTGNYLGDGTSGLYVWGAQLEQSPWPTSYIPTTSTTMTRKADVATVSTSAGSWFNASQGTLMGSYQTLASEAPSGIGGRGWMALDDGTLTNRIYFGQNGTGNPFIIANPSTSFNVWGSFTAGNLVTAVLGYQDNNSVGAQGGAVVVTNSSVAVPTGIIQLDLGGSGFRSADGWIQSVQYYNTRLSDAAIQELSHP